MTNLEPIDWPEAVWRLHVEKVRAGKPLLSRTVTDRWPGSTRCAVLLSFDSDHETPYLRDGLTSPGSMAQGEYGARVGVPRILELLERYRAPSTFFIPAVCALLRPNEVPSYVDAGHEIAVHGWIHERTTLLSYEQELDLTGRAMDVLEFQAGVRPVGIRTPSWDFSEATLRVIRELRFRYDSSLMADDEPYELLDSGIATGVVEVPVEWIRDDAAYFLMDRYSGLRPYTPPRDVAQIWIDEFDAAYSSRGVFQLTLHPHISGHPSRIRALTILLDHIASHENVWFTTHRGLVDHVSGALSDRDCEQ
ncbi:polysaccharide deacetylase [Rhodococcus sp. KBW08]|uniref:polysaccharide deacetylase family protein n=1 Tax=Rhodococcus sp. KBW08 TaxID=2144188 RepID=UPI000F599271|nr:polysaccharide deacetylase [Rhodococcus sp. KBW08]RQO46042.1 polysaccharide deacetylase [Rhodococcus sp. KBW08]